MKQLEVQIMGQSYLLGTPDNGDERLLDAVARVDAAMCKIRDAGKIKARDRIAVLAALNLAFELSDRAAPATPATPATEPLSAGVLSEPIDQTQLDSLLSRLDNALGSDGRLL
jgi:cell division protein ZapA